MKKPAFIKKQHFDMYDNIIPFFRLMAVFIVVIIALKSNSENVLSLNKDSLFLIGYTLYSLIILFCTKWRRIIAFEYPFIIVAVDLLLLSYGIVRSGGSISPYYLFYILYIAFFAIAYNSKYCLLSAFICILYYGASVYMVDGFLSRDVIFRLAFFLMFSCFTGFINERIHKKTYDMAVLDKLTSLYNYQYFYNTLDYIIDNSHKSNCEFSLAVLDIDNFKSLNDTSGHLEGDRILSGISNEIILNIRPEDIAARYGGDELVIVFPNTDAAKAITICERIKSIISERFRTESGEPITASIGIASYPHDGKTSSELFNAADHSLYHAKNKGKNTIVSTKVIS